MFIQEEWQVFSTRGLHLIYLNINSLVPEINELRDIAKKTKAAVIRIAKSKLDSTVLGPEIYENFEILRFDGNQHWGGVACCIRNDIGVKLNTFQPNVKENITLDVLMAHTKLIIMRIIYRPPNQSKFLDIFEKNLPKPNASYGEIYFPGEFNFNLFENGKYVFDKSSSNNKNLDSFTKRYHECCALFGLGKCPTHLTGNSSSILDYVQASFPAKVSQSSENNVNISDFKLIYCTRKTARIKSYCHN